MPLIPANVEKLRESIKSSLSTKSYDKDTTKGGDNDRDRKRRMAELKAKQREAEQSKEQLAEELAAIKAELEEVKNGRGELEKKIAELEPSAKNWTDHEHREKQLLISKLPAELKKEANDMSLKHLRLFVKTNTGGGSTTSDGKPDWSKMTDDERAKLAETNPEQFLQMLEGEKK